MRVMTLRISDEQYKELKERAHQSGTSMNMYLTDLLFPPDAIELCKRGEITKEELMRRLELSINEHPSIIEFLNGRLTFEALRQDYESQIRTQ